MLIKEIKARWDYNPTTGVLTQKAYGQGTQAGRVVKSGSVLIAGKKVRVYRIIWALMTGEFPTQSIDHIDGNRLNNKWSNLRLASARQQSYNTVPANGGCYKRTDEPRNKPWRARIRLPNGKRKIIGDYSTEVEARAAYRQAAMALHGEFYYGKER
jgi:hypothetical protein